MAKNFTPPTKNLHSHGRPARVTKFDEPPLELTEAIATIPLNAEQFDITTPPTHPQVQRFNNRLLKSEVLQEMRRERKG